MKGYSVVVAGKIADEALRVLDRDCEVTYTKPYQSEDEFAALMDEVKADGLLVRGVSGKVTRKVMEASGRLRVIAKHGVGVDNIDVAAATILGIPVLNTPAANFEAVAEHALGLILALAKDIATQDARMRAGFWDKMEYRGTELFGKTIGLVGYGRIGRRMRELVAPLQMKVLVFDPALPEGATGSDVRRVAALDELLAEADIVSLHCPLVDSTRGLIGPKQFDRMKKTAFLINTARGPIVSEAALIDALKEGKIAGAGIDTFEKEPPERLAELANSGKTVLTPHLGAATDQAFVRMGVTAAEGVLKILNGGQPDPECHVNRPR